MSVSPLYLLLQHAPFGNMVADDLGRVIQAVSDTPMDPGEQVDGLSAMDRFILAAPKRDTAFAHDVIIQLAKKGIRAGHALKNPGNPPFYLTRPLAWELMTHLHGPATNPVYVNELRLGACLLDEVYWDRPSSAAMKALNEVIESEGVPASIGGMQPLVWLASKSNPGGDYSPHFRGWAFDGTDSERRTFARRIIRASHAKVLSDPTTSDVDQWIMDVSFLAWSTTDKSTLKERDFASLGKRWKVLSDDQFLELSKAATARMSGSTTRDRRRAGEIVFRAAHALSSIAFSRSSFMSAALLLHGLPLMKIESGWTKDARGLETKMSDIYKSNPDVFRLLAGMDDGLECSLDLWSHLAKHSNISSPKSLLRDWFMESVESSRESPHRLFALLDRLASDIQEGMDKLPDLRTEAQALISAAKEAHLERALPSSREVPSASRPRF